VNIKHYLRGKENKVVSFLNTPIIKKRLLVIVFKVMKIREISDKYIKLIFKNRWNSINEWFWLKGTEMIMYLVVLFVFIVKNPTINKYYFDLMPFFSRRNHDIRKYVHFDPFKASLWLTPAIWQRPTSVTRSCVISTPFTFQHIIRNHLNMPE